MFYVLFQAKSSHGSVQELVAVVISTSICKVSIEKTDAFMVQNSVSNKFLTYNCCYFSFSVIKLSNLLFLKNALGFFFRSMTPNLIGYFSIIFSILLVSSDYLIWTPDPCDDKLQEAQIQNI